MPLLDRSRPPALDGLHVAVPGPVDHAVEHVVELDVTGAVELAAVASDEPIASDPRRLAHEVAQQPVCNNRPGGPVQATESARICETQCPAIVQLQVNVIVLCGWFTAVDKLQAAGHAEMQDGSACICFQKQVLGAPADVIYHLSREFLRKSPWHGPAKAPVTDDDTPDSATGYMRRNASSRGFDFRKFRHAVSGSRMLRYRPQTWNCDWMGCAGARDMPVRCRLQWRTGC